jgi:hypothetical protein
MATYISLFLLSSYAFLYEEKSQSITQMILKANSFYDPNSDVLTQWSVNGSATHFGALDDGVRNTSTPTLTDYIYISKPRIDQIGFPTPNDSDIGSIILWVYSSTGSNAKTTINLLNNGTTQATLTVNPGSPGDWRSATWQNPGSISTITVEFTHSKQGGGASTESIVYAAYIEVVIRQS